MCRFDVNRLIFNHHHNQQNNCMGLFKKFEHKYGTKKAATLAAFSINMNVWGTHQA